jgi:CDP-glycerol glycerophosphotransferase (TagB/SpsB family)
MGARRVFIIADHGLAIVYFLQSDVVPTLLEAGVEVVLLTDDGLVDQISRRFGRPGLVVERLRLSQARAYAEKVSPERQWWLGFLRRVGSSDRINTAAMDSYVEQVAAEEPNRRRLLMPLAWLTVALLRRSRAARRRLVGAQRRFTPALYGDLFDRYQPSLVVASTAGWRLDRYLLREAAARKVPTAAAIVGWDNPSSYSLSGAPMDFVTCWSEIQKEEFVLGSDWPPERVHIGGIPIYDGYFRGEWRMPRQEYFRLHNLDPERKLLSYACSFVSFAPNYRNVEALARLVSSNTLAAPSQLLVRLHPNHFMDVHLFAEERRRIRQLAQDMPHVHVVEPVPIGGELGYYSGEDMPEKTSMMAHSDVFLTVYSTMVVEAAIHDRPIVSVCLDTPGGWNTPRKYSLPLSRIGDWPTHDRFRKAKAGQVALSEREIREAVNAYLKDPTADREGRQAFIEREVTFKDGSAGRRTGEYLGSLL